MLPQELRRLFLGAATDFTDHDDALGCVVLQEQVQAIDEVGSVERVSTDTFEVVQEKYNQGQLENRGRRDYDFMR